MKRRAAAGRFNEGSDIRYFDTNAYYNSKYSSTQGSSASVKTPPPKKYLISTCGMVEGGPEDWSRYSYEVYCDIDALKTELKRIFKNKAIPGQPTTKSGKPYKEIYYSQIYVDVDDMENVSEVQSAINAMGYQASSNAEWVQAMQTQYGYSAACAGRHRRGIPFGSGYRYYQHHDDVHL